MTIAYLALGSNLGEPHQQLLSALAALRRIRDSNLLACSPVYRSAAVGPGNQPDYLNAVAALDTALQPGQLLDALQAIETAHGRRREIRWGPRTLDLDILLFGDLVMDSHTLTLPHPRLATRNFVLYPLHDLDPGLTLPCGTRIASLLRRCPRGHLQNLGPLVDLAVGQESQEGRRQKSLES
jgi:2-amino-4-hydroxy-6-hydroxymethyldihydropteridine diphosphokinase